MPDFYGPLHGSLLRPQRDVKDSHYRKLLRAAVSEIGDFATADEHKRAALKRDLQSIIDITNEL